MNVIAYSWLAVLLCAALLSGCAGIEPHSSGEFVKSVYFSPLDTFRYERSETGGMQWRDSERSLTEALSERVLSEELAARGFTQVDQSADFYVLAKWQKRLSTHSGFFDHIDGASARITDSRDPDYRPVVRYNLVVEIYQTASDTLFWRADLPNLFDATQYTEDRVVASLRRAIRDFPPRVEKDLSLPNFQ